MSITPHSRAQQFITTVCVARVGDAVHRNACLGSGNYAFIHGFYRQAWYQRLVAGRRAQYHRELGEYLSRRAAAAASEETSARIAWHLEHGGEAAAAIQHLVRAADFARCRFATTEAVGYLSRALNLAEGLRPDLRAALRFDLLAQRGLQRRAAMEDMPAAMADFQTLRVEAQQAGRVDYQVKALLYLAIVLVWADVGRCLAAADQAVSLSMATGDADLQAHARGFYGHWHTLFREWDPNDVNACKAALDRARASGDRDLLTIHLRQQACFEFLRSEYAVAANLAEEGMQLALHTGDAFEFMVCQFYRGLALLHQGRWGEMHTIVREGLLMAERNRNPFWTILFQLELAWLYVQAFDYESACTLCENQLAASRSLGYEAGELLSLFFLASALLGLEQHERGLAHLRQARARIQAKGTGMDWYLRMPLHQAFGTYYFMTRQWEQAQAEATAGYQSAARAGERTWMSLSRLTLARIADARNDPEAADAELARARELVKGRDIPLAEWQICTYAARRHARPGRHAQAVADRSRAADLIRRLAASLAGIPALQQALLRSDPARSVGAT